MGWWWLLAIPSVYVLWHKLVIVPAASRIQFFGPRWLSKILTDMSWFLAGSIMQMPFETNEKEAEAKGTLQKQSLLVWHPHGPFCGTALLFGGNMFYRRSTPKQ